MILRLGTLDPNNGLSRVLCRAPVCPARDDCFGGCIMNPPPLPLEEPLHGEYTIFANPPYVSLESLLVVVS
jgi:hypothetical protein